MRNTMFTLSCAKTEVSHAQLCFVAGPSLVCVPLYIICCLEHKALVCSYVWNDGDVKTSDSRLVQISDVQPMSSLRRAKHGPSLGCV